VVTAPMPPAAVVTGGCVVAPILATVDVVLEPVDFLSLLQATSVSAAAPRSTSGK
jgi:hypothetical protein